MVKAREREEVVVEVEPASDLAKALKSVDAEPVVLVSNGERFRVSRDETTLADDEAQFEEALRAAFGILTPEEGERRIQEIHRWREEGSRPVASGAFDPEDELSDDELWADYDPEAVREALRAAAGTLTEEEGEFLKALIYEGREAGTRRSDRP